MSKFKAGEKIAFYYADHGFPCRNTGVVEEVNKKGVLRLHLTDVNEYVNAHTKQCRRLVKREKRACDCSLSHICSRVHKLEYDFLHRKPEVTTLMYEALEKRVTEQEMRLVNLKHRITSLEISRMDMKDKKKCGYCAAGSRVYRADAPGQCFNCLRKF